MSSLIKERSSFQLNPEKLDSVLEQIKHRLNGRVESAYIFGSASEGTFNADSDIDLILIVENDSVPFLKRAEEFIDLYEIWPKLDLLIYTQQEFEMQLADSDVGFWKSVRLSLKKIF